MRDTFDDDEYDAYCYGEPSPRAFASRARVSGVRVRERPVEVGPDTVRRPRRWRAPEPADADAAGA